jgi:hypothetical protein
MVFLVECSWIQNELGGISSSSFLAIAVKPGAMRAGNTAHRKRCLQKIPLIENAANGRTCLQKTPLA